MAFVRAVMIGREGLHREVLLDMFRRAGATDVVNHISTGNVSFALAARRLDELVATVEHDLEGLLARPTPLFVRSLDDLRALVERRPFDRAPHHEPRARLVTMVRDTVTEALEPPIVSPRGDYHVFAVEGGEVFSITVDTGGRVQDPGGLIERLAGEPVTTRAWGTIERIVAKLA